MYSVVLLTALTSGQAAPDFFFHRNCGGCYASSCYSSCYSGHGHHHGHRGCWSSCYGSCYSCYGCYGSYGYGCYGGSSYSCYGGAGYYGYGCYGGGCYSCYGSGYGVGYVGCHGGYGCYNCFGCTGCSCYGGYYYNGGSPYQVTPNVMPSNPGAVVPNPMPQNPMAPQQGTSPEQNPMVPGSGTPVPAPKKVDDASVRSQLVVELPEDARLFVDGIEMKTTSNRRVFVTPPLQTGRTYFYDLRAEMQRDGQPVAVTGRVVIRPGQNVRAELSEPTPAGTFVIHTR